MVGNSFNVRERSEAVCIRFHFPAWGVVRAGMDRTTCIKYSPIRAAADLIRSSLSLYSYLLDVCYVSSMV